MFFSPISSGSLQYFFLFFAFFFIEMIEKVVLLAPICPVWLSGMFGQVHTQVNNFQFQFISIISMKFSL